MLMGTGPYVPVPGFVPGLMDGVNVFAPETGNVKVSVPKPLTFLMIVSVGWRVLTKPHVTVSPAPSVTDAPPVAVGVKPDVPVPETVIWHAGFPPHGYRRGVRD